MLEMPTSNRLDTTKPIHFDDIVNGDGEIPPKPPHPARPNINLRTDDTANRIDLHLLSPCFRKAFRNVTYVFIHSSTWNADAPASAAVPLSQLFYEFSKTLQ